MKTTLNLLGCAIAVALTFIVCCTDVMAQEDSDYMPLAISHERDFSPGLGKTIDGVYQYYKMDKQGALYIKCDCLKHPPKDVFNIGDLMVRCMPSDPCKAGYVCMGACNTKKPTCEKVEGKKK